MTPSIYYENEVQVDKSAAEAWAVMTDESNLPDWIEGFVRTESVSGVPNTVGAISNVYVEEQGTEMVMQETIKAFKPGEHLAMEFSMDFMDMDYEVFLNEKDGKTNIKTTSRTMGNGLFAKSMISFMPKSMKAQEDKNLNSLKNLIDANTKNYFPEPVSEVVEMINDK